MTCSLVFAWDPGIKRTVAPSTYACVWKLAYDVLKRKNGKKRIEWLAEAVL